MDSDEDLYGILGVEPGAAPDAIRAAFRTRVRENHSDGKLLTPEETARADARTAVLNHAWHVLSDPGRRRQYDEQRKLEALLRRSPNRSPADAETGERAGGTGVRTTPQRSSPSIHGSHLLRSRVLALAGFHWEKESCAGFEWALSAKALLARHLAALRHEEVVDLDVARRFLSAARTASETLKARTKRCLFVLMYDRMTQPEQVKAACAHFSASEESKGCCVVLYDASRSRALLCAPPPEDEKTRKVLGALGV